MEIYDYIVVGAGSSGCVVAGRLSEDPAVRVLLVEAGPSMDNLWVRMPAGAGKLFMDKRFNWAFDTEPVPTLGGRTVYWPRGKGLGGSSSINGMIYMRGQPGDFDHWAALGNDGWGWPDVLPYFIRSETNQRGANDYHGEQGPLHVSDAATGHPTADDFIAAAEQAGIPRSADLNGPPHEGVAYRQYTIRNGRRHTSYNAFVEPVRHRRNLTVRTGVRVTRVVLEDGEAVGIEVLERGERRRIVAAREVILSGGALASPHLLMLSGIGDPAALRRHGIVATVDSPEVGRNLQDHWFGSFAWRVTPDSSYNHRLRGLRKYLEGARYLLTGGGYLALGAAPVTAYARSEPGRPEADLQLTVSPMTFKIAASGEPVIDDFPAIGASVVLLTPDSRGHMELKSSDPLQPPAFHPNYLSEPGDIRRSIAGLRLMRRIAQTAPLASRIVDELAPGASATTDEQLLSHLRTFGNSGWHQVGTCRMGSDPRAVVDPWLRVRGVGRLRVVDASIMPRIVAGNTNAACIMIGEKAADMIRAEAVPCRPVAA
ncbi:GMC family oxidoreductase [Burkholderia pseudomultivorans]|uniref:Alcohol dehydrogenase (Acceptor) n=1 Tax=Burkholderia pseudomultivorans TaxID=1207504 RepID=A0ABU2E370_9BURK|nr:GMC family oxidoreductase N-terminal domain-containing protein [Burkholderia pseudomultivorans]MDR8726055.1 Alcohol dehydrogenase (acceptor) [Burkholderia pseudomultivorans]MDR8735049.1 Alcohol dehydrogenase (acceptor) [Burkholderia pseudomultivorans]MDR8741130.1 Alcohol dehydrogenase (acceptor) [Burkholderia pseudomultivorans]MDR8754318.1 Alcohol dehydrogenase (acceptor) [Burkholderia pseudomultivorans]MDR8777429.1 Alcohol dehydrogenase (acceptor) [Burkholderia pseudomultivorans]